MTHHQLLYYLVGRNIGKKNISACFALSFIKLFHFISLITGII